MLVGEIEGLQELDPFGMPRIQLMLAIDILEGLMI